jgi:hypothetical protein
MADQLSHKELQELAKELNITTPILAHRVVGDRVEVHLLGGREVIYDPSISAVAIPELLSDLTLKELRLIAQDLGVSGYSKMTKAALVKALSNFDADTLSYTFVKLNF